MSTIFTDAEIAEMEELALTCRPFLKLELKDWPLKEIFAGLRLATLMSGRRIPFGLAQVPRKLSELLSDYPWPDNATA